MINRRISKYDFSKQGVTKEKGSPSIECSQS